MPYCEEITSSFMIFFKCIIQNLNDLIYNEFNNFQISSERRYCWKNLLFISSNKNQTHGNCDN